MGAGVTGRAGESRPAMAPPRDGDGTGDAEAEQVLVGSAVAQPADRLLTHPPRPRKKKRR
jgi:hypothetical protein